MAVALIAVLVVVNILGVRYGAALQNLLMFIKFGAIVAVSLVVFAVVQRESVPLGPARARPG